MKIMEILKKIGLMITVAVIAATMTLSAFAAAPGYILDFSAEPYPESSSGDGDWNYVNEDGKRVLLAEVLTGPPDSNGDFYMVFGADADMSIDADKYQWMKISLKNLSDCPKFEFHFAGGKEGIAAGACTQFDISANDTEYKTYIINIPQKNIDAYTIHNIDAGEPTWWTGEITQFRPDFMYIEESGGQAPEGSKMYIEYIAFFETEEDAVNYTFTPTKGPKETDAPAEAPTADSAAEATVDDAADTTDITDGESEIDTTDTAELTAATPDNSESEDDDTIPQYMLIIIALSGVTIIVIIVVLMTKKR